MAHSILFIFLLLFSYGYSLNDTYVNCVGTPRFCNVGFCNVETGRCICKWMWEGEVCDVPQKLTAFLVSLFLVVFLSGGVTVILLLLVGVGCVFTTGNQIFRQELDNVWNFFCCFCRIVNEEAEKQDLLREKERERELEDQRKRRLQEGQEEEEELNLGEDDEDEDGYVVNGEKGGKKKTEEEIQIEEKMGEGMGKRKGSQDLAPDEMISRVDQREKVDNWMKDSQPHWNKLGKDYLHPKYKIRPTHRVSKMIILNGDLLVETKRLMHEGASKGFIDDENPGDWLEQATMEHQNMEHGRRRKVENPKRNIVNDDQAKDTESVFRTDSSEEEGEEGGLKGLFVDALETEAVDSRVSHVIVVDNGEFSNVLRKSILLDSEQENEHSENGGADVKIMGLPKEIEEEFPKIRSGGEGKGENPIRGRLDSMVEVVEGGYNKEGAVSDSADEDEGETDSEDEGEEETSGDGNEEDSEVESSELESEVDESS